MRIQGGIADRFLRGCFCVLVFAAACQDGMSRDGDAPSEAEPEPPREQLPIDPAELGLPISTHFPYCEERWTDVSPCEWTAISEAVVYGEIIGKRLSTDDLFSTETGDRIDAQACGPIFEESLIVTVRTQLAAGKLSAGTDVELHFGYDVVGAWSGDPLSDATFPVGNRLGAQLVQAENGAWTPLYMPLFAPTDDGEIVFSLTDCSVISRELFGRTAQELFNTIEACSFADDPIEPHQALWAGICFN